MTSKQLATARSWRQLLRDTRGVVMTEYVVVVGMVALAAAPALLGCAWAVVGSFLFTRSYVLYPFP
jgi:Flp pilus assembly pilin Flp